jgi:hypothetical protein
MRANTSFTVVNGCHLVVVWDMLLSKIWGQKGVVIPLGIVYEMLAISVPASERQVPMLGQGVH